jgi:hypothetical protein
MYPYESSLSDGVLSDDVLNAGARFYRGSNRDVRRRERNERARQRKREGIKPKYD